MTLSLRHWSTAFAAMSFALTGCNSGESEPVVYSRSVEPIQGGTFDTTRTSVVGMVRVTGQGALGGMCSGTLIAPNLVLTARHCVSPTSGEYVVCGESPFGNPYPAGELFVTTDARMSQNSKWYGGAEVIVPDEGNDTCGFDVALLILDENVPQSVTRPYIPRIDIEPIAGEPYVAVGYGLLSDSNQYSGGERYSRDALDVQCGPSTCTSNYAYALRSTEWLGDTGVCSGDSGGPALDLQNRVIGVVSRGGQGCSSPVYGAVTAWRDLIVETAEVAAVRGGYDPPNWVVTGSSEVPDDVTPGPTEPGPTEPEPAEPGPQQPGPGQGRACGVDLPCPQGYACVFETSEADAFCAAQCDSDAQCGTELVCAGFGDVTACAAPAAGADGDTNGNASGCSIAFHASQDPAKPVPWAIGVGLMGLVLVRRRRARR